MKRTYTIIAAILLLTLTGCLPFREGVKSHLKEGVSLHQHFFGLVHVDIDIPPNDPDPAEPEPEPVVVTEPERHYMLPDPYWNWRGKAIPMHGLTIVTNNASAGSILFTNALIDTLSVTNQVGSAPLNSVKE